MVCFVVLTAFANLTPERRLSSRVVRTKYGGLRGSVVTLPNKNLQPVEVFLGMYYQRLDWTYIRVISLL